MSNQTRRPVLNIDVLCVIYYSHSLTSKKTPIYAEQEYRNHNIGNRYCINFLEMKLKLDKNKILLKKHNYFKELEAKVSIEIDLGLGPGDYD